MLIDLTKFSRRRFLALSGAGFAASYAAGPWSQALAAEPMAVGDAHVHLFNLSDLPAEGFFKHVVLPNNFGDRRELWPALIAMINYLKPRSVSATEEDRRPWRPVRLDQVDRDISSWSFALMVVGFIGSRAFHSPGNPARFLAAPSSSESLQSVASAEPVDEATAFSSELLARTINLVDTSRGPPPGRRFFRQAPNALEFRRDVAVRPEVVQAMVEGTISDAAMAQADEQLRSDPSAPWATSAAASRCDQAPTDGPETGTFTLLTSRLRWAHLMMQSRQYHLAKYHDKMRDGSVRPNLLINLLVDYDRWLGDGPEAESSHDAQIALWTKLAARHSATIDIRTFAGFDPLKDAEQFIRLGSAYDQRADLTRYRGYWLNGRNQTEGPVIRGFKLYPPLGFRPINNRPSDFDGPEERSILEMRKIWNVPPLAGREVANEIEASLMRFYRVCDAEGIPLLAHGRHSNEAGRCFGERAGPDGWLRVLTAFPNLKLCLGHFTEAADFEIGMRHFDDLANVPINVWPLRGIHDLLRLNTDGRSRVYCDLSYMSEFLRGSRRARTERAASFFRLLRTYCERYDPECRHFLYGSDWVMLDQEPDYDRYLGVMRDGMAAADWPEPWQQNLLNNNLRSFLGLPA